MFQALVAPFGVANQRQWHSVLINHVVTIMTFQHTDLQYTMVYAFVPWKYQCKTVYNSFKFARCIFVRNRNV